MGTTGCGCADGETACAARARAACLLRHSPPSTVSAVPALPADEYAAHVTESTVIAQPVMMLAWSGVGVGGGGLGGVRKTDEGYMVMGSL